MEARMGRGTQWMIAARSGTRVVVAMAKGMVEIQASVALLSNKDKMPTINIHKHIDVYLSLSQCLYISTDISVIYK